MPKITHVELSQHDDAWYVDFTREDGSGPGRPISFAHLADAQAWIDGLLESQIHRVEA